MTSPSFKLPVQGSDPKHPTVKSMELAMQSVIDAFYEEIGGIVTGLLPAGTFDASVGSFPEGALHGVYYFVSVAGTVDGEAFAIGDWLVPLVDDASTSTFAGNWTRGDYSKVVDAVYDDVPALAASMEAPRGEGALWATRDGFRFIEAASSAADYDLVTSGDGAVKLYVSDDTTDATALGAPNDADPDGRELFSSALVASMQARKLFGVTLRDLLGRSYAGTKDAAAVLSGFIAELAPAGIAIHDPDNQAVLCEEPIRIETGMKLHLSANSRILKAFSAANTEANSLFSRADWSVDTDDFLIDGGIIDVVDEFQDGKLFSIWGSRWEIRNTQILGYQRGQAFICGGYDFRIMNVRSRTANVEAGTGAFRCVGGARGRIIGCHAEAGDDLFQFVPIEFSANARYDQNADDILYIGCTGTSHSARVLVAALELQRGSGDMLGHIRNCGWIGCGGKGGKRSLYIGNTEGANYEDQINNISVISCVLDGSDDESANTEQAFIEAKAMGGVGRVNLRDTTIGKTKRNYGLRVKNVAHVDISGGMISGEESAIKLGKTGRCTLGGGATLLTSDQGGGHSPGHVLFDHGAEEVIADAPEIRGIATGRAAVRANHAAAKHTLHSVKAVRAAGATDVCVTSNVAGAFVSVKNPSGDYDVLDDGGYMRFDAAASALGYNVQRTGTSQTLAASYYGKQNNMQAGSAITLVIPDHATNPLPYGEDIEFFVTGAGTVTIDGSAVTLYGATSFAQGAWFRLRKVFETGDTWVVVS